MTIDVSSWLPALVGPVTIKDDGTAKAARAIWDFVGIDITDDGSTKLTFTVSPTALSGLGTGVATWLATPSSANLRAALTDETGTGAAVFAGSPTLTGVAALDAMRLAVESNALAGSQNDVAIGNVGLVRVTDAGAVTWTGIAGGAAGRLLLVTYTGAATLTLTHDATSTAANRFYCPGSANVSIGPNGVALLVYDGTSSRWRVLVSQSPTLSAVVASEDNGLAGAQNDVALATASTVPITFVRYTDAGAGTWTGIAGGAAGRIVIISVTGGGSLTINYEDAASSEANRATFPGAANLLLNPENVAILIYDGTTARWRGGLL